MWDYLALTYKKKSVNEAQIVMREIINLRLLDGDNVDEYLQTFEELSLRMDEMGESLSESQLLIMLEQSLPPSYRSTLQAFSFVLSSEHTYEVLKAKILEEYVATSIANAPHKAFSARGRPSATLLQYAATGSVFLFTRSDGVLCTNDGKEVDCRICGANHTAKDHPADGAPDIQSLSVRGAPATAAATAPSGMSNAQRAKGRKDRKKIRLATQIADLEAAVVAARAGAAPAATGFQFIARTPQSASILLSASSPSHPRDVIIADTGASIHGTPFLENLLNVKDHRTVIEGINADSDLIGTSVGDWSITTKEGLVLTMKDTVHAEAMSDNILSLQRLADTGAVITLTKNGGSIQLPTSASATTKGSLVTIERPNGTGAWILRNIDAAVGGERYFMLIRDNWSRMLWVFFLKKKNDAFPAFLRWQRSEERTTGELLLMVRCDHGSEFENERWDSHMAAEGIKWYHSNVYTAAENSDIERGMRTTKECAKAALISSGLPKSYWTYAIQHAVRCESLLSATNAPAGKTAFEAFYGKRPNVRDVRGLGEKAWIYVPEETRRKGDFGAPKAVEGRCLGMAVDQKGWQFVLASTRIVSSSDAIFWEDELESATVANDDEDDHAPPPPPVVEAPTAVAPVDAASPPAQPLELAPPPPPPAPDAPRRSSRRAPEPDRLGFTPTFLSGHGPRIAPAPDARPLAPRRSARVPTPRDAFNSGLSEAEIDAYLAPIEDEEADEPAPPPVVAADGGLARRATIRLANRGRVAAVLKAKSKGFLIPRHRGEAMASEQAPWWRGAEGKELGGLVESETYDLVDRTALMKPISCHFVYDLKKSDRGELIVNEDGTLGGHKARLVARGDQQNAADRPPGWEGSFAATAAAESLRFVLAEAAQPGYTLYSADVKGAYLEAELPYAVHLLIPKTDDPTLEAARARGQVMSLKKCLYGLVESGYFWSKLLRSLLVSAGFTCLDADRGVYVLREGNEVCYVPTHVDDLLAATNSPRLWERTLAILATRIRFSKAGLASYHLGALLEQSKKDNSVFVSQAAFTDDLNRSFGITGTAPTPMAAGTYITSGGEPLVSVTKEEFATGLGKLGWLLSTSRPDIAVPVRSIGRFAADPREEHWIAMKRILRYLNGTKTWGIRFRWDGLDTRIFSDSDWAGYWETRQSRSGWLVWRNGPISWGSLLQGPIALSSAEAELYASATAIKRALPILFLGHELGLIDPTLAIPLLGDNTATLAMMSNENTTQRTRHIDLRFKFVKRFIATNKFRPVHLGTADMPADLFTKALGPDEFRHARSLVGMVDVAVEMA
ncbi:hypothetical protein RQP46_008444 [Phenoliferia psychrophenolica]